MKALPKHAYLSDVRRVCGYFFLQWMDLFFALIIFLILIISKKKFKSLEVFFMQHTLQTKQAAEIIFFSHVIRKEKFHPFKRLCFGQSNDLSSIINFSPSLQ